MKLSLTLFLATVAFVNVASAVSMSCFTTDGKNRLQRINDVNRENGKIQEIEGEDHTYGVVDTLSASCQTRDGRQYNLLIEGVGLGLGGAAQSTIEVSCPFSKSLIGSYYGVKADAAAVVQAGIAMYAGKNGACVLGNLGVLAIRVDLSISKMTISRVTK